MPKVFDAIESCFNILGLAIGVNEIESWLGITLVVINILAILIRAGIKIYDHLRHGRVDDAIDEVEKARDDINKLDNKDDGSNSGC